MGFYTGYDLVFPAKNECFTDDFSEFTKQTESSQRVDKKGKSECKNFLPAFAYRHAFMAILSH